jgi:hypothetical protein
MESREEADTHPCIDHQPNEHQQTRVEYWSKTYQMWIPAEITAVDHDMCAVQVNVKPGVWLASNDWDKKIRVAVYNRSAKDKLDDNGQSEHEDIEDTTCNLDLDRMDTSALEKVVEYDCEESPNSPMRREETYYLAFGDIPPKCSTQGQQPPVAEERSLVSEQVQQHAWVSISTTDSQSADDKDLPPDVLDCGAPSEWASAESLLSNTVSADVLQAISITTSTPAERTTTTTPTPRSAERISSESTTTIPPVTFAVMEKSSFISEGRFAGYRCPNCDQGGLESIQAAVDHCALSGCTVGKPISSTGMAGLRKEPPVVDPPPEAPASWSRAREAHKTSEKDKGPMHRKIDGSLTGLVVDRTSRSSEVVRLHSRYDSSIELDVASSIHTSADDLRLSQSDLRLSEEEGEVVADEKLDQLREDDEESLSWDTYFKAETRILGYCCPECGQGQLSSLQEAVRHCRSAEVAGKESNVFHSSGDVSQLHDAGPPKEFAPDASETHQAAYALRNPEPILILPGEPVAFNEFGHPIISRQIDPSTGNASTMVLNETGTCDVFGKQTVASLLSATQDEAQDWFHAMSVTQLRGLVHELGQRLVEASSTYQARLKQYEGISEKSNLAYFGLGLDATDRDLDVAYRQMSKKMHPDKNGGTEESKIRFQEMKTRYEDLKKRRGMTDDAEKGKQDKEKETEEDDDKTIAFDPTNRDALNETAAKMLTQLSTLDASLGNLVHELRRHGLVS